MEKPTKITDMSQVTEKLSQKLYGVHFDRGGNRTVVIVIDCTVYVDVTLPTIRSRQHNRKTNIQ